MSESFTRLPRVAGPKHFCPKCGRSLPQPGDEAVSDETVIEPAQSR